MTGKTAGLQVGQFCKLLTSDYAYEYGIKKGDYLYVAGDGVVNVGEEDPYQLRRILVCAKVCSGGHIDITTGGITIDGLKLGAVSDAKQKKLHSIYEQDFAEESEEKCDDS